jgi:kynurenine formamidase
MAEISRRQFIEAAGLAAAAPAFADAAAAAQRGQNRADAARRTTRAADLSDAELEAMFKRCSNTGKWGPNDEKGTLNYITPAKRVAAAALVKTGDVVSVGRDLSTRQTKTDARPMTHILLYSDGPSAGDYYTFAPHGMRMTHMDSLAHFSWHDQFYNGRKRSQTLSPGRAAWGSIFAQKDGIFTRGVLLNVAAARGVDWLSPDEGVHASDLEAAEKRQRVRVESGDCIFVYTGLQKRESVEGPENLGQRVGIMPDAIRWMHQREISVYSGDCVDAFPNPYGVRYCIYFHAIALAAMGLILLDIPALEPLVELCNEAGRSDFLVTMAPLRIKGGTGSPVNPIAVF